MCDNVHFLLGISNGKKQASEFSKNIFRAEVRPRGTIAITSAACFYKGNHQQQV